MGSLEFILSLCECSSLKYFLIDYRYAWSIFSSNVDEVVSIGSAHASRRPPYPRKRMHIQSGDIREEYIVW